MRAIVIKQYGGPDQLQIAERPAPDAQPGQVVVEVKAIGLNRAELYMRAGAWGDVAEITGIECVGTVRSDPDGRFTAGQKVAALMGGMGRTINGSYAELVRVPAANVVPIATNLSWEEFAAIPETFATAWSCLHGNLALAAGQVLVIRGATSALGRAAINIAAEAGARIIATTRNPKRAAMLEANGATEIMIEAPDLSRRVRERHPRGVDAVLDIVGNSTILDSLAMARRYGRVCLAGLLDHGDPIANFNPLFQMPFGGVHFSSFASAFTYGTPDYPLTEIPLQTIIDRVAAGAYVAKPARVLRFDEIREAHRLMEANEANGKVVVRL
jgi:NADPH:quinone reductase-like Zn-dependent oxidoreductase